MTARLAKTARSKSNASRCDAKDRAYNSRLETQSNIPGKAPAPSRAGDTPETGAVVSFVRAVLMIPVSVFVAVIVIPGMRAPLASATVPPSVELLVCANNVVAAKRHRAATRAKRFLIVTP
jgi:hypothetical protein